MKLKNILMTGLALTALTACNDFLDIDAPSKQTNESIFTKPSEISTALNNVYVQALSGDTYGNSFIRALRPQTTSSTIWSEATCTRVVTKILSR